MAKHDLIFFEKRSTPKVIGQGKSFTAPESYGKQTKRRAATEEEEKVIARGEWLRVDQNGTKGGQNGYKKTRMKGREHLVKHGLEFETPQDALAHYGVKGMRWGVTTKDRASEAVSQKRMDKAATSRAAAEKAKVAAKEFQDDIDALGTGARAAYTRKVYSDARDNNLKRADDLVRRAEDLESGKLTTRQKRLIALGAVGAGLVLAGYVGAKSESGELNAFSLHREALREGRSSIFRRNEKFAQAKTHEEVMASVVPGINPNYATPGGQMNCRRCSFAYELRRRGYDVSATATTMGRGQSETGLINALTPGERSLTRSNSLSQMVVGGSGIRGQARGDTRTNNATTAVVKDARRLSDLRSTLMQQPDGARGEAVFNFGAFGHSLSYERFGDKIYIFDTQKGKSYDLDSADSYNSFLTKWGMSRVEDIQITRLDDQPLDERFLARWATHRT